MKKLETIMQEIGRRRNLGGVERTCHIAVDMERALAMMELLGQARTPRFAIDGANRWVYSQLIRWLYGDASMMAMDAHAAAQGSMRLTEGRLTAGLYIAGPTGTGKSWALELLDIFADIDTPTVRLGGKDVAMHYECHRAEDIWERSAASDSALEHYKGVPILCIQDLGSEPDGDAVRMGTRREPLRQLLESRGDRNDLLTLISSNYGPCSAEIERRYTARVVSRLCGMCNLLVLNGPDRRSL